MDIGIIVGLALAIFLLGYLAYAMARPEKF